MLVPGNFKKTRIAPTPSGFLHLGNVLSFSITAALACQGGAKILLRIDDLDVSVSATDTCRIFLIPLIFWISPGMKAHAMQQTLRGTIRKCTAQTFTTTRSGNCGKMAAFTHVPVRGSSWPTGSHVTAQVRKFP